MCNHFFETDVMYEFYFKKIQIHCEGSWARSDYIMQWFNHLCKAKEKVSLTFMVNKKG